MNNGKLCNFWAWPRESDWAQFIGASWYLYLHFTT